MRLFLAARAAACWLFVALNLVRVANAQTWNDPRSTELVNRATARRAQQLADTGLADYQATAHGYVTFLAQLGEGFLTPPKIIKADELESEVYWHAPNQSKQRIIGRRDTLLLPTDISYHRDHLGIVQNNFPDFIRIGDGDEVRDVPHPLSAAGRRDYDFFLADSFAIGSGAQRIRVYEVKVRPKDDRQPRVVGAIYLDPSEAQVVRMSLSFTRAAFLDEALEELSVVLENRLVGGRFWLPSRQTIEIRRTGTWLDYPIRGIIRGRWEIGDYRFNLGLPPAMFSGPEIVQSSPAQLKAFVWKGAVLDSLPPDVRAVTEADVQRVQAEARELVRAQALARAQHVSISARNISDFVRFDRVEGLALGEGLSKRFGHGIAAAARARYGIDDHLVKASGALTWQAAAPLELRVFGLSDFREVGDEAERSGVVNTVAAQEWGSDYTDYYRVQVGGVGAGFSAFGNLRWQLEASIEQQDSLSIHAQPVVGAFEPTIPAMSRRVFTAALRVDRPTSLSFLGTEVAVHADARIEWDLRPTTYPSGTVADHLTTIRGAIQVNVERPFGVYRLVSHTIAGGVGSSAATAPQDLIYYGGPVTAPGYDYHSLISRAALGQRLEWQVPIPFPAFSLGRFGRVPATATIAPYVSAVTTARFDCNSFPVTLVNGRNTTTFSATQSCIQGQTPSGTYPSMGVGFLTPFNLLRLDVARGVGRGGRWAFYLDVSREYWRIL
jgi:hypothetical protein